MLGSAALPFGGVAGKQYRNGVKVGPGEAAHPVVRMILSGVAEHLRAGDHSLPELLGKRGQRSFVHAQCAQAVPGEGHRHPAFVLVDRSLHRRGRLHLVCNRRQPGPSARGVAKRKEFVSPRECRRARQQDVLDVVEFKHAMPLVVDHCIWSSMLEKAALSISAFLISSALTKGYSPYSRKLGR